MKDMSLTVTKKTKTTRYVMKGLRCPKNNEKT